MSKVLVKDLLKEIADKSRHLKVVFDYNEVTIHEIKSGLIIYSTLDDDNLYYNKLDLNQVVEKNCFIKNLSNQLKGRWLQEYFVDEAELDLFNYSDNILDEAIKCLQKYKIAKHNINEDIITLLA